MSKFSSLGGEEVLKLISQKKNFFKSWFDKEFLPALLTPRNIPKIEDDHEKLIHLLYKENLISKTKLENYQKASKNHEMRLKQNSFEKILKKDKSDSSLQNLFDTLFSKLNGSHPERDVNTVISEISIFLFHFLKESSEDVENKICHKILEFFSDNFQPQMIEENNNKWHNCYVDEILKDQMEPKIEKYIENLLLFQQAELCEMDVKNITFLISIYVSRKKKHQFIENLMNSLSFSPFCWNSCKFSFLFTLNLLNSLFKIAPETKFESVSSLCIFFSHLHQNLKFFNQKFFFCNQKSTIQKQIHSTIESIEIKDDLLNNITEYTNLNLRFERWVTINNSGKCIFQCSRKENCCTNIFGSHFTEYQSNIDFYFKKHLKEEFNNNLEKIIEKFFSVIFEISSFPNFSFNHFVFTNVVSLFTQIENNFSFFLQILKNKKSSKDFSVFSYICSYIFPHFKSPKTGVLLEFIAKEMPFYFNYNFNFCESFHFLFKNSENNLKDFSRSFPLLHSSFLFHWDHFKQVSSDFESSLDFKRYHNIFQQIKRFSFNFIFQFFFLYFKKF